MMIRLVLFDAQVILMSLTLNFAYVYPFFLHSELEVLYLKMHLRPIISVNGFKLIISVRIGKTTINFFNKKKKGIK